MQPRLATLLLFIAAASRLPLAAAGTECLTLALDSGAFTGPTGACSCNVIATAATSAQCNQCAQLELKAGPTTTAPYSWAPFLSLDTSLVSPDQPLYRLCLQYLKDFPTKSGAISDLLWGNHAPAKALSALKCSYLIVKAGQDSLTWACANYHLRNDAYAANLVPGYLKVSVDGGSGEYVAAKTSGAFGSTSNPTQRLLVRLANPSASTPFDIYTLNSDPVLGKSLFGGVGSNDWFERNDLLPPGSPTTKDSLSPAIYNWAITTLLANPTGPGSVPIPDANPSSPSTLGYRTQGVESTIWTLEAATKRLTATWINPDGKSVKPTIIMRTVFGALHLGGNYQKYCEQVLEDCEWQAYCTIVQPGLDVCFQGSQAPFTSGVVAMTFEPAV